MERLKGTCLITVAAMFAAMAAGCGGSSDPPTYSMAGSVSDLSTGGMVAGVTITLSGARSMSTTTGATGSYSLAGLPAGTYTVTPSMSPFTFVTSSAQVTLNADSNDINFVRQSYSIAGQVTAALTGVPKAQASIAVSGTVSGNAATDTNGQYRVTQLANGDYDVSASLTGAGVRPYLIPVAINGANVSGQNFVTAVQTTIASGITFLTDTRVIPSRVPRTSVIVRSGNVYFSDSSAAPIKKVSLSTHAVTSMALRLNGQPESAVVAGQWVYWRSADSLYQSLADGSETTVVASGMHNPAADGFAADLAVDATSIYFVEPVSPCNGTCMWEIRKIPRTGGSPVTLAAANRRVVALTSDAANIYWEQSGSEPVSQGCGCGSSINRVAKAGGAVAQIVDGMLNAPPPALPPGYLPGSWLPTGGITVDSSHVYFAVSAYYGLTGYQVSSVPLSGGTVTALAMVPSGLQTALRAIQSVTYDNGKLYWIDMDSGALYAMPAAGGAPAAIATASVNINYPSYLAIAAGRVFWTEPGTYAGCCLQSGAGKVRSVLLTGGSTSVVNDTLDAPTWLTTDGTFIVWAESWRVGRAPVAGGSAITVAAGITTSLPRVVADDNFLYALDGEIIKKLPLNGGAMQRVAATGPTLGGIVNTVTIDDALSDGVNLYWTVSSTVYAAPLSGGPAFVVGQPPPAVTAPGTECFGRIAIDTQYIYWLSGSATYATGCSLVRVPLTGGTGQVVFDSADLQDFAIDGTTAYVAGSRSGIHSAPLAGGVATLLAPGEPSVLISDATNLYWLDSTQLWMQSKSGAPGGQQVPATIPVQPLFAIETLAGDRNGIAITSTLAGEVYLVQ